MVDESSSTARSQVVGDSIIGDGASMESPQGTLQPHHPSSGVTSALQDQHMSRSTSATPFEMNDLTASLPEYVYRQIPQSMYQQTHARPGQHSAMMYPYQGTQYPTTMHGGYPVSFPVQMHQQNFSGQSYNAPYQANHNLGGQQMFHGQAFFPHQQPMSPSSQGSFQSVQQGQPFAQMPGPVYGARNAGQYYASPMRLDNLGNTVPGIQTYPQSDISGIRRTSSTSSLKVPSALRGPPRKPKQSGHALWVGNLPPGTNIIDLKDHFSRDATNDIESVFLISKSNCAFVNYKSEQSCTAAMGRFHDSRFNGVRLVCRLRRGSSPTTSTPPARTAGAHGDSRNDATYTALSSTPQEEETQNDAGDNRGTLSRVKEKYFIIKSLTIEDLERSVHNGIWATQSHNEEALNKAFQMAENVYLIFSANKSGEYFGYARMDSEIDSEATTAIDAVSNEAQPLQQPTSSSVAELPLTIPTPATATAPRGYIIDDSARGTIFWEVEPTNGPSDPELSGTSPVNTDSGDISAEETADTQLTTPASPNSQSQSTTFGKPFKITWISTDRLPFYRTRGLRNPWNTNREVKIARDGTELEPSVGRKLVGMFSANAAVTRSQSQGQFAGMMVPMPGQGPTYRPF